MLKSFITSAWRNLFHNKIFSFINILGLALGLACSLLILLWVQDERGVDGFHTNGRYLYQVYERTAENGKADASYVTQCLLAEELQRNIPGIQYASALEDNHAYYFKAGDKSGKIDGSFADTNFFRMFSYPLLYGTPATSLASPGSIAISRKMANQFFGGADRAIGQSIRFENAVDLHVTAVFENMPANSSQQFEFLRCWKDFMQENAWASNWGNASPATLVQLRAGADAAKVQADIKDFIYRYRPKEQGSTTELGLQLYTDKYLHSTFENGRPVGGRIEYVRLFSIVGAFVLLIACINFMNLATARSARRAKEVGIRKVVGALRALLVAQFIGEAILLTLIAIMAALVMVLFALPAFNGITGKQLILPITQPVFWFRLAGLLLLTGIVAGSYPALFLSSLKPVKVLKGSLKFSSKSRFFRQALVVLQFTLSIMLILSMVVTFKQMAFIQNKNLGYDRENLVYIPIEGALSKKYETFKAEVLRLPGVTAATKMRETPTLIGHSIGGVEWQGKPANDNSGFSDATVGYDFAKTMKLQLVAGRDFSQAYNDTSNFMINEAAADKMGYKNAVGKPLSWGNKKGVIVGVVKNFHFTTMHENIQPLVIKFAEELRYGTMLVRIKPGKTRETIATLEPLFRKFSSDDAFTYQFSDQEYTRLYKSETIVSRLAGIFAFLAIFISCLGLLGLAAFTAQQRIKEIGVRKVLGASISNIFSMLSAGFLKPIVIAMLIGLPIASYAMTQWLNTFAYKIGIEWWMFVVTGVATAIIALITVSYQSVKAALSNPVKSLRTE